MPKRVEWLKLPGLRRDGEGEYRVHSLPLEQSDVLSLRAELICCTVKAYRPDLVVVDKIPSGVKGELMATLETLATQPGGKPPMALLLRDILDDGETIHRQWAQQGNHQIIADYYDMVLVAGQPDIFDVASQYAFPESTVRRLRYCGYIRRRELLHRQPSPPVPGRVLVTSGGGEDGAAMLRTYLSGLAENRATRIRESLIITGPEMDSAEQSALRTLAAGRGSIELISFHHELPRLLASASAVVCMCGYNTICESLSLEKPVVTIPRVRPVREQLIRAQAFAARGWLRMFHPDELCAPSLLSAVDEQLSRPFRLSDKGPDFCGLERIAYWVRRLLAARTARSTIEEISAPAFGWNMRSHGINPSRFAGRGARI